MLPMTEAEFLFDICEGTGCDKMADTVVCLFRLRPIPFVPASKWATPGIRCSISSIYRFNLYLLIDEQDSHYAFASGMDITGSGSRRCSAFLDCDTSNFGNYSPCVFLGF